MSENPPPTNDLLGLTAEVVSAFVSNNSVSGGDLPGLIAQVHRTLASLASPVTADPPVPSERREPAVSIKKSVTPDFLICLEDGKKMRMLKLHLATAYGLTPDAYRAKWNLPSDYPMTAPNYAKRRSELAKGFGLGRKQGASKT